MAQLVTDHEIAQFIESRRGWRQVDSSIVKTFQFPSFPDAIAFVDKLVAPVEAANHHPDINIIYKQVTLKLWTHDASGLTKKDFALADEIDKIVS
ncbi:MAG: 4a-hydroxytetrahydrobiopterin dehydratase [Oligoflexus sp.]